MVDSPFFVLILGRLLQVLPNSDDIGYGSDLYPLLY